jgi:hypothetical protein
MSRRLFCALVCCASAATFLCLGFSSAQAASSGSLTIAPVGVDQISVSGTGVYDCASTGNSYCGWFPDVTEVLAGQPCVTDPIEYVGDLTESPTASFAYNFSPYNWTYGQTAQPGIRLCLYVNYPSYQSVLVAQADYTPPAPTPSPAPTPTDPTRHIETLSQGEAKAGLRTLLRHRYGRKFTRGTGYHANCHRLSRLRMKCKASWNYNGKWRVTATARATATTLHWTFHTSHHTHSTPAPTSPGPAPTPPSGGGFCDTHPGIPNFNNGTGYIVQCNDGMWSHSGGKQGACSGHGGVSGASASSSRPAVLSAMQLGMRERYTTRARLRNAQTERQVLGTR